MRTTSFQKHRNQNEPTKKKGYVELAKPLKIKTPRRQLN